MSIGAVFMFGAMALCQGAAPAEMTADELVKRVIASRRKIETGDVTYRVVINDGPLVVEVRSVFDRSSGKDWLRFDVARTGTRFFSGGKPVEVLGNGGKSVERLVLRDGTCMSYVPDEYSDGSRLAVSLSARKEVLERTRQKIVDPPVLGVSAHSFGQLGGTSLEGVFAELPLGDARLEQVDAPSDLDAPSPVWKLELTLANRALVALWISPRQGYSVLRARADYPAQDGQIMVSETTSQLRHFEEADVWFPEAVSWVQTVQGEVVMTERIEIQEAEFNREIDSKVFSLEGLDIRPGTSVDDDATIDDQFWDGQQLVTRSAPPPAAPVSPALPQLEPRVRHGARVLIVLNIAAVVAIAALLYWRKRRQAP